MAAADMPGHPRRWAAGLVAWAVLLAPALVGCAAAAGSPAAGAASAGPGAASKAGAFSSGLSIAQQKAIYDAQGILVRNCMAKAGFGYRVLPFTPVPGEAAATASGSATLYVDTRRLRADGYGIYQRITAAARGGGASAAAGQQAGYPPGLPPRQRQRYQEASFGTRTVAVTLPDGKQFSYQPGGCVGRAEAELYGNVDQYNTLLIYDSDIYNKVRNDVLWSPAWHSAQAAWSRCLAGRGYHYVNEVAAETGVSARYASAGTHLAAAHRYEMRVAAQDAACTGTARLNSVSAAGLRAAAVSLTSDQAAAALTWNRMQDHAAGVAKRVLAQSSRDGVPG